MGPATGRLAKSLTMLAVPFLLAPSVAHAYLDPGTGSYVVQVLIGTFLGGLFALGVFWRRVLAFVRGILRRRTGDDADRT